MCFSATASFVAGALLLPTGAATLAIAWKKGQRQKLPLAAAPLLFGLQQTLEGMVWLGIQTQPPLATTGQPVGPVVAALAYLFFAYVFWPVWMPLAAVAQMARPKSGQAPFWRAIPALGLVPALTLWLPFLNHPRAAIPEQIGHSLVYALTPWSAGLLPPVVGPLLYAALIVLPFLKVPSQRVRSFALTLLVAFGLAQWLSSEALTSVWCYASALLSLQILWILQEPETGPESRDGGGLLDAAR
ncbi:MAG: hypothetical protein RLZZ609_3032 [Cyanobacteriota bacterium]|jgi:hypothetical protein